MRIVKDSIYRDVPDYKAAEYFAKGYVPVAKKKETETSPLENLTMAQLAEYALERGIDLAGAKKKADMISIIEASLKGDLLPKKEEE